jgi:sRNA-binding protein
MLDVLAKYPKADEPTLVNWVRCWTGHWQYLKRIPHGCNRHDLEGNDVPPSLITSATKHAGGLRRGTERRENRRDCSPDEHPDITKTDLVKTNSPPLLATGRKQVPRPKVNPGRLEWLVRVEPAAAAVLA